MFNFNNILVMVAHQDDETIGCGGFIKKMSDLGKNIRVVFFTDGSTGIDSSQKYSRLDIIDKRKKESINVSRILGFDPVFLNHECQNLRNSKEILHDTVKQIRNFKPDLILTHLKEDKHRDHKQLHDIVIESSWKSSEDIMPEYGEKFRVKDVWGIEVQDIMSNPDFCIDIDYEFDYKISAMSEYKSQKLIVKNIQRFISGLSLVRGYQSGVKRAEAFKRISLQPHLL